MSTSLSPSHEQFTAWLSRLWSGTACALYDGGAEHLLPTCFAVLAAECSGVLEQISATKRTAVVDYIRDRQRADTGLFDDGEIRTGDVTSHSPFYLYLQQTYFALHALDALGAGPKHALSWANRFKSEEYARGWLDAGPWNNPWLHSNNVMFALSFLQHMHDRYDDCDALGAFDNILDYLDERQDAETGMWQPEGGRDDRNAVFAAYHFFPFYFWRRRSPKYTEQIIDTTLGIQAADGFYVPGGGACEDLDAVHTLVMMALRTNYRADDVKESLLRCAQAILDHQNADGGFSSYVRRQDRPMKKLVRITGADRMLLGRDVVRRSWCYSGWKTLSCPIEESDMWSAWFRPLSLRLIAELYPDEFTGSAGGSYRRMPGLGWHDAASIRDAVAATTNSVP